MYMVISYISVPFLAGFLAAQAWLLVAGFRYWRQHRQKDRHEQLVYEDECQDAVVDGSTASKCHRRLLDDGDTEKREKQHPAKKAAESTDLAVHPQRVVGQGCVCCRECECDKERGNDLG